MSSLPFFPFSRSSLLLSLPIFSSLSVSRSRLPFTMSNEEAHKEEGETQIDPAHAGGLDSKDSRSHANTVAAELAREKEEKKAEEEADEIRPTDLAKAVRFDLLNCPRMIADLHDLYDFSTAINRREEL